MCMESAIPDDARRQLDQICLADVVVGIPSFNNGDTIGHVVRTVAEGVVKHFPDLRPVIVNSDGGSSDDTRHVVLETEVPSPVEKVSFAYQGIPGKGSALRAVFEAANRLGAQACIVVDSDLRSITPEWIELLAAPIVNEGYDFVAPLYLRHKHDGTITNNIAYPVTRALYGQRIRQPIGGDFGVSTELSARYLASDVWHSDVAHFGIDIFMTTVAINEGFNICQSRLGAKIHDVKDPAATLGPMFVQVVGTLFALMETYAARWQAIEGSQPTPVYGKLEAIEPEPVAVTLRAMVDKFRAGAQRLYPLWGRVLAPEVFDEVMNLIKLGYDEFFFPIDLWARVVYDFAASYHHARSLGVERNEVVEGLSPLYYGRTAAMVADARDMNTLQFEQSIVESQAQTFEARKPYLLERWQEVDQCFGGQ